jgi:pimeloyl-ACP methyl ester carboxylesterase
MLKAVRWVFPKVEAVAPFLARRFFVKIFFTPLNYRTPEKELLSEQKAEKFTIRASGKTIQCYRWGTGEKLVLVVHGWAGRATQFRKFIDLLTAKGYKVIGFDGPAHGKSSGTSTDIYEFYECLKKIYEHEGEPEAVLAHSFGGSAVLFSAMNGLPVKKLINIASPTIGDEIINTYLIAINGSWKTGNYFKEYVKKKAGKPFDEFTALHFVKNLKQEIHLLLVHDENDDEVPLRHALELIKVYPKTQLFKTKGLGHTRILKDETVINKSVTFIEDIRLRNEKL